MMIVDEDVGPGGARVRARPRRAAPLRASDPTKGTRASRRYPRRRAAPRGARARAPAGGVFDAGWHVRYRIRQRSFFKNAVLFFIKMLCATRFAPAYAYLAPRPDPGQAPSRIRPVAGWRPWSTRARPAQDADPIKCPRQERCGSPRARPRARTHTRDAWPALALALALAGAGCDAAARATWDLTFGTFITSPHRHELPWWRTRRGPS